MVSIYSTEIDIEMADTTETKTNHKISAGDLIPLGKIISSLSGHLVLDDDGIGHIVLAEPSSDHKQNFFFRVQDPEKMIGTIENYRNVHRLFISHDESVKGHQARVALTWIRKRLTDDELFRMIQKNKKQVVIESIGHQGKVLDVEASRDKPGAAVIIYYRSDTTNQRFEPEIPFEVEKE